MMLTQLYPSTIETVLLGVKVHAVAWGSKEAFSDVLCSTLRLDPRFRAKQS